jgi:hypothetical protein
MTTTQPLQPKEKGDTNLSTPHSFTFTPTMSTFWVPLDATIGLWADFGKEAMTVPALLATGTAFYALSWEVEALRHYTLASQGRTRGREVAHLLGRAVQDLNCAIDQWQQVLAWLHLAGNDKRQDRASLDTIRSLMGEANEHQQRRRALHLQVQQELAAITQRNQKQHAQGKEMSPDASIEDTRASS